MSDPETPFPLLVTSKWNQFSAPRYSGCYLSMTGKSLEVRLSVQFYFTPGLKLSLSTLMQVLELLLMVIRLKNSVAKFS